MQRRRTTPQDVAKAIGVTPQFIRVGMQQGRLPYGYALKMSANRWTYHISPELVAKAEGITLEEFNRRVNA